MCGQRAGRGGAPPDRTSSAGTVTDTAAPRHAPCRAPGPLTAEPLAIRRRTGTFTQPLCDRRWIAFLGSRFGSNRQWLASGVLPQSPAGQQVSGRLARPKRVMSGRAGHGRRRTEIPLKAFRRDERRSIRRSSSQRRCPVYGPSRTRPATSADNLSQLHTLHTRATFVTGCTSPIARRSKKRQVYSSRQAARGTWCSLELCRADANAAQPATPLPWPDALATDIAWVPAIEPHALPVPVSRRTGLRTTPPHRRPHPRRHYRRRLRQRAARDCLRVPSLGPLKRHSGSLPDARRFSSPIA